MAYKQKRGRYYYVYVKTPDPTKPQGFRHQCYTKHPETGTHWTTAKAALDWGREKEIEVNKPKWVDPRLGEITWDDLWKRWNPHGDGDMVTEVDENTADFYTLLYRTHIGPRYGKSPIGRSSHGEVTGWLKDLRDGKVETGPANRRRQRTYAPRTTEAIFQLMKLMLGDASQHKPQLLDHNPLDVERNRNRGRRVDRIQTTVRPKLGATPEQILAAAVNIHYIIGPGTLAGMGGFMRVLTAGFSAIRPGESAALERNNCLLDGTTPQLVVDDDEGTWEQRTGQVPRRKNPKSGKGRVAVVPLGFAALLAAWLAHNDSNSVVFPNHEGEPWSRFDWRDRWNPAAGGGIMTLRAPNGYVVAGDYVLERAVPGLEFKGLRRVWNVWATERGIPDIARTAQLGHAMSDDMQAAYSLMSPVLEAQIRTAFQDAWAEAFRGYAGIAALGIIRQFAPTAADAGRRALASGTSAIEAAAS